MSTSTSAVSAGAAAIEPRWFREVLGQYPTGVCVVTALPADGNPVGLAVGSFTSVSLDPPLVAFLADKSSTSWPRIRSAGRFCVNILGADQEHVCRRFASKAPDKFEGLEWRAAGSGSPLIAGVVAWIDCDLDAVHPAGDHDIVVGSVRELQVEGGSLPLLFFQGGYGRFTPLSLAASNSQGDLTEQLRMVDRVRLELEALAAELECQCILTGRVADELVIMASAGRPARRTAPTLVGQRAPFAPPLGAPLAAWGPAEVAEAWLAHVPMPAARDALRERLGAIRGRGYSVGLLNAAQRRFASTLDEVVTTGSSQSARELRRLMRELDYDPVELSVDVQRSIRVVVAPVFGAGGEVALILTVFGFPNPARLGGIEELVSRVLAGAARATEASR
jgi:flavin reductase (DIM6/NTAB) family NADH-FMN oxidoreductase RutF/DNA-binding IclR family transcriptional regulator